ncbi:XTP/dITP diphosphatase [Catenovulum maritimum]|uniref:dITP/XTP pyrophosphatase n=1 Tax=Catenovulum maritimum TaxID=1513271 RepID=A0A0J8GSN2_9ALTE|nr:XTP/dITP diphosphatase [Catenovulum maritimum]KMT65752.1 nucleoside-triphosphate diphosphatase [Catenovulum maritimum]
MTRQIVLATGNKGKVKELNQMLKNFEYEVKAQSEFNVPDVAETGLTFVENALIKARNASKHTGLPAIADDSGIEVECLNGKPGIYSARYAGENATDKQNLEKLLSNLEGEENRTARFQCVLVYLQHENDPTPIICQGTWTGSITHQPSGENGFGYDPIFWLEEQECTSADLPAELKNKLSHRGQALVKLMQQFQSQKVRV